MATVTVRETLKGKEGKSISFLVASWLAPEGLHDMASPPHVYKKGDAGIWLVRSGRVSHTDGLLTEERRDEVKGILKSFAERKWSEPIQGLQFWASAVRPEYRSWPVLICAVRNASDEPNFLPLKGVVFVARDVTGKEYVYPKPLKPENEKRPVYCSQINPAELTYVPSNDWLNFDIVLECELPAGKYQILAFFQNDREGEIRDSKQSIVRVNAWKGKLAAEPFELVVEPGMRNR